MVELSASCSNSVVQQKNVGKKVVLWHFHALNHSDDLKKRLFPQTMNYPLAQAKHILVVQPLVGIGDMIWHKPWLDKLMQEHRVTLAAKPTAQTSCLFPQAAEQNVALLSIERSLRGRAGRHDGIGGFLRLARDFRRTSADAAVILHHSPRYALACKLAGIPCRIGYGHHRHNIGLNKGKTLDKHYHRNTHAIERIKIFSEENGFPIDAPQWQLTPNTTNQAWAEEWLRDQLPPADANPREPFFIFGIGAMHGSRCWPVNKFAALADMILNSRLKRPIVLLTGPDDHEFMQQLVAQTQFPEHLIPLQTRLENAIAVMRCASGFIGNDSGPLNIMACLQVPSLGLFSQSKPLRYSPHLHNLELFKETEYGTEGLIDRITAADVFERMLQIW